MHAKNKYRYCHVKSEKKDCSNYMTEQERLTDASLTTGKEVSRTATMKVVRTEVIDGKLYNVLSI